ncbi:hypothetical protein EDF57_10245 [Novosphingobium sp. PhB55]|nr:hypothetical protein EDF57_10245 [Novosphingobium sp. PhB55]
MMPITSPLASVPIVILGLVLLAVVVGLTWLGMRLGTRIEGARRSATVSADPRMPGAATTSAKGGADDPGDDVNSAIVPAVLGLLALLLGFTFALAVDRFETRRGLVLEEANAIGTAYLQTQILPDPHRARLSALLTRYTDNRIALAGDPTPEQLRNELAENNRIVNDIWSATLAGFDSIRQYDMSSTFVSSINAVIDLDTSRKTGRMAHVPEEVFWVLIVYVLIAAFIIGYIIRTRASFYLSCVMNLLVVMSLMLIMDIDRPASGGIRESQFPMLLLSQSMRGESRADFDRWRTVPGVLPATQPAPQ